MDGIEVIRVWTYLASNKGTLPRILNFVSYMVSAVFFALFLKRPDIVVATSPQFFCGWAGVWYHRLRGIPFVLEIRDLWPETIIAIGAMRNRRLLRFVEWLEKRMYRAADRIVTVGGGYREKLLERGVADDKIDIVMNGADLHLFTPRPADPALKRAYGLENRFVCAYVGTLGLCSGLDVVHRAGAILKREGRGDIRFLLVGDGAVREDLIAEARSLGVDNVVFAGRQPKNTIPDFIALADVCLAHLQRNDLFKTVMPSKIFEAAAMRKPIVLGVEGFAADLLQAAGGGVCIEPENEVELARALTRLADEPALAAQYGENGYNYVNNHFDRRLLAEHYLGILRRMVGGLRDT